MPYLLLSFLTSVRSTGTPDLRLSVRSRWPFREAQGIAAFTVSKTSCANTFPGSPGPFAPMPCGQTSSYRRTRKPRPPPTRLIRVRGGNDFLSGTLGGSSTLTVGISFASCTLAISYSWVSVSKTASSTLVLRYKSA